MLTRQLYPDEFDGIPEEILKKAAAYGTGVHKSVEDFDTNWDNDGTQEVQDYIEICKSHNLVHEASEYTVTDGKNWASNIDKVYRVDDDTFDLGDIKTYGVLDSVRREKARWQLSIYAYLFELQNKKAKVDRLFIMHLRNKFKTDGTCDNIKEIIFLKRIPSEICKELLDCDLRGEQFQNPFGIPEEYKSLENEIRQLMQIKAEAEEKLGSIKARIMLDMEEKDAKTWATDSMRITRKLPTTRTSFNLALFKKDHPEIKFDEYMKTSQVAGSLQIAI